jgi:tetratricopeptide (TPR) repeat protein
MIAVKSILSLCNSAAGLFCGQLMIRKTILFLLASAVLVRADPAGGMLAAAGAAEFNTAYQAWDGTRFGKAAELFQQATAANPTSAVNHYWLGTALFHRMLWLENQADPKTAAIAMDAAAAALEKAVKLDPGHAESHALLGTLYGMKIKASILRAIRYGPSVQNHQQQALKFGPANPRVRYLLGTGQFHTAKDAAARREALNTLLAAEKLYNAEAKQPAKEFEPRWGYSSCLTFIARSNESLGQKTEAETYYRKALTIHPADHVAKEGLNRLGGK